MTRLSTATSVFVAWLLPCGCGSEVHEQPALAAASPVPSSTGAPSAAPSGAPREDEPPTTEATSAETAVRVVPGRQIGDLHIGDPFRSSDFVKAAGRVYATSLLEAPNIHRVRVLKDTHDKLERLTLVAPFRVNLGGRVLDVRGHDAMQAYDELRRFISARAANCGPSEVMFAQSERRIVVFGCDGICAAYYPAHHETHVEVYRGHEMAGSCGHLTVVDPSLSKDENNP